MKILNVLLLTLFTIGLNAQVFESKQELSVGLQNAYACDHPEAEKKMVEKALEETLKEYGKVKKNRKAKEWCCQECKVPSISSNPLNIYYKVEEGKGQVTSYIFIDDGEKFLTSNNSEAQAEIERLNMNVFYSVERMVTGKKLEQQENTLKDYNKDLQKLEKKNKILHDDIEDYKEKIRKAEKDIEENLQLQESKKIEIEQQKNKVGEITKALNNIGRS